MGFFSDLGSIIGDVVETKNELVGEVKNVVEEVKTPIVDASQAVSQIADDIKTTVSDTQTAIQETAKDTKDSITNL